MLPSIFSENLFDDFFNSAMFPKAEHELYGCTASMRRT